MDGDQCEPSLRRFTIFTQSSPHSSAWDNESGRAPSEPSRALRFPLGLVLAGCQPVSFGLLRPSLMTLFMIERQDPDDVKAFDTRSNIEDRIILNYYNNTALGIPTKKAGGNPKSRPEKKVSKGSKRLFGSGKDTVLLTVPQLAFQQHSRIPRVGQR